MMAWLVEGRTTWPTNSRIWNCVSICWGGGAHDKMWGKGLRWVEDIKRGDEEYIFGPWQLQKLVKAILTNQWTTVECTVSRPPVDSLSSREISFILQIYSGWLQFYNLRSMCDVTFNMVCLLLAERWVWSAWEIVKWEWAWRWWWRWTGVGA
jgi:hypothetical protein